MLRQRRKALLDGIEIKMSRVDAVKQVRAGVFG